MTIFITQITLVEGGPAAHVTVYDQNGNAIPPANITWASASELSVTPNSTGFNVSAVPRGNATSFPWSATLTTQTPAVTTPLTVNIVLPAVTSLQFSSP